MTGFKDMTFCEGKGCIKFDTCPRALTQEVKEAGTRWWGSSDFPVSIFAEPKELECYVGEKTIENKDK